MIRFLSVVNVKSSDEECNAKDERRRIQVKNDSANDDGNSSEHDANNLTSLNEVGSTSSPNNTCGSTKRKRKKRLILNDSSSDEEIIPSENVAFPDGTSEHTTNLQSMPDSSDSEGEGAGNSLVAKRRILDDSSSDEGVVDPYPGDEPTSLLLSTSSSPLHISSATSPCSLTSQTNRSETPMSKRCRESSPELLIKKRRNTTGE